MSFFFVFGFILALSGCGRSTPEADFVFINGVEPESLDPALITAQADGRIVSSLFEGLTSRDAKGRIIPGVAESWDISGDGRTYTFKIRDNARWSNGDRVTAQDFMWSWRRALLPETASKYSSQLYFIENAEAFNTGKITDFSEVGVSAPDDSTLVVHLTAPTPFFLDLTAFPTLMPVHRPSLEEHGDDWIKPGKMVSNGPYQLEKWRINDRIRITANPYYWDKENVNLKTVDILPTTQAGTAFNLFYSGAADLILDRGLVPAMLFGELRKTDYFHSGPILAAYFYRFNVTRPPFNDVRVRRALSLAVDKQRIVEKITKAGEPVAHGIVPPGTQNYTSPVQGQYDPEQARKLLAEAGFPGGRGFPRMRLLYNKTELNEQIATELQQMWSSELGIPVDLEKQEFKVYLGTMSALDYDVARSSWIGDYNDANTFLSIFTTGDGNNRTGWSNAEFDALIARANREPDIAKREKIFQKAEKILIEDEAVLLPLYFNVAIHFFDPEKVGGVENNLVDEHPIRFMYKKKP
ncbi:peptide ABC transporter substrate-binding protein [Kamptonema cortianum]|nr:peptide ABC transporter substrate-binding protein [Kamptonema cortianum]